MSRYTRKNAGHTGSLGRYSFMAGHNADLFQTLYHSLNLSGPGMDDMPSRAPGQSMATQAKAAGYQDIFRNIQAMRIAEFKKQEKEGVITPEFSGTRRPGNLSGGFSGIRQPGNLSGGFWFNK